MTHGQTVKHASREQLDLLRHQLASKDGAFVFLAS